MAVDKHQPEGRLAKTDMGWGPEAGPWDYRVLSEPRLSETLESYANAAIAADGKVHTITFQPCLEEEERSQDRYTVQEWPLPDGTWTFTAVFDGHGGHELAELAVKHLPDRLKANLDSLFTKDPEGVIQEPSVEGVSSALTSTLLAADEEISADIRALFPGGDEEVESLTIDEIKSRVNDHHTGGENHRKVIRGMRGTTALIALVDPKKENLWVANLGDCQAVLAQEDETSGWAGVLLTQNHNGGNEDEVLRVQSEHPAEVEVVLNQRVLGAIAVTRALGDHAFKLPAIYTKRVFMNAEPGFRIHSKVEEFIARSFTPPYLSANADIHHRKLQPKDKFILLCSDGLTDLYPSENSAPTEWVKAITDGHRKEENNALRVLRAALGGDDEEVVSRHITVEMMDRWMDDTTILVYTF